MSSLKSFDMNANSKREKKFIDILCLTGAKKIFNWFQIFAFVLHPTVMFNVVENEFDRLHQAFT